MENKKMLEEQKKDYNTLDHLDGDEDILEEFLNSTNSYIGDIIAGLADSYVNIHHNTLWENAPNISEYIEEAIAQGLTEGVENITKIFQYGEYQYYTEVLYNNLDKLIYNYGIEYLQKHKNINNFSDETLQEILEEWEYQANKLDNNSQLGEIVDYIEKLIDEYN